MTYIPDAPDAHDSLANEAMTDEPFVVFGELTVDLWKCVLVKGQGKVPYNEEQHKGQRSSIVITLTITPLDPQASFVTREPLNWTAEWRKVTRLSIEELATEIAEIKGLTVGQFNALEEINGMYVQADFPERPDNEPGETWTAMRFRKVYADEMACHEAWVANRQGQGGARTEAAPTSDDPERNSLAAFLPALWRQAQQEQPASPVARLAELIEVNDLLIDRFDLNSPEVQALTAGAEEDIPF